MTLELKASLKVGDLRSTFEHYSLPPEIIRGVIEIQIGVAEDRTYRSTYAKRLSTAWRHRGTGL
jgi:hypothetical protein